MAKKKHYLCSYEKTHYHNTVVHSNNNECTKHNIDAESAASS
jgi:hypothetical protein